MYSAIFGPLSGVVEVKSPADKFFRSVAYDSKFPFRNIEDEMETMSLEDRTLTVKMSGDLISKRYKKFEASIKVDPKEDGDGSRVAWTVEFEKNPHGPDMMNDTLIVLLSGYLRQTDERLLSKS